ncbi:unnamed protein product [Didymodactylos carnosus]|uniref:Integrase catalytic domain-containing protein n=1 Tax=Didymodactylos carnosus TaxID=1234261 RepID=A0A815T1V5_9BILA|nr:unnamed protein product [Didymodactylos carnosus]CAF4359438.1 unnamed protein product [Didymodactylos carnosus]
MRKDVGNYVHACDVCQRFKANTQKLADKMISNVVHEPWYTIGIDITGPLPSTKTGNTPILVVVDYFTKWVELFPLQNTRSTHIAQILLDEAICRFGCPVKIFSDNGSQFISEVFEETLRILQINHRRTALYHPQTNLSERVNNTLKTMIRGYAQSDQRAWDVKLPQLAFALRTVINDSTGESPDFLMFGREPRLPIDVLFGSINPSDDHPTNDRDVRFYRDRLTANLLPAFNFVREHLEIAQQNQRSSYDRHRRDVHFELCDLLMMATTVGSALGKWKAPKLDPRWVEPFKITKKITPLNYQLTSLADNWMVEVVHVERLRPYYSPFQIPSL